MMTTLILIGGLVLLAAGLIFQHFFQKNTTQKKINQQNKQQFDALFNQTAFGVVMLTNEGKIKHFNQVFGVLIDHKIDEIIQRSFIDFVHPEDVSNFEQQLEKLIDDENHSINVEIRLSKGNNQYVWTLISCAIVQKCQTIIGQVIDISDRKEAEETIFQLAYYDTLTGLPNRLFFNQHAKQTLERAQNGGWKFAMFMIDLDNFKAVNDTYGHHIGDTLLKEIALKLTGVTDLHCELEGDCSCFCSRLGGDEFIIIVEHIHDSKDANQIIERIFSALDQPIIVGPHLIPVTVSIGISMYPYDGYSISSLLRSADLALYTAKDRGKNTFFFHEIGMNQRFEQQFEYRNVIKYFLDTKDFNLLYQPIVDTNTGKITGAEVLLGGNKQKYPRLNIGQLITFAETDGTIIELGSLILEKACRDYVREIVPIKNPGFSLSINVSMRQLEDSLFVNNVAQIIHDSNISPEDLILEITETAMSISFPDVAEKLKKLSDIGIRIAIDDFGKGYSSMSQLRQLNTHKLKIDKSLIDNINTNSKGKEIVRAVILMSHALDLTCTAEGVEDDNVFRVLRDFQCDEVQGYLISPSLMMEDFKKYLVLSSH